MADFVDVKTSGLRVALAVVAVAGLSLWLVSIFGTTTSSIEQRPNSSSTPAQASVGSRVATTDSSAAPVRPQVRLAVAGDIGTGAVDEYSTALELTILDEEADFDALLLLGDNVYNRGEPELLGERVYDPFRGVLDGQTQLIAALGNHDIKDGHGPAIVAALGMPGFWYSTQIGNVLIVTLDSNRPDDIYQLDWLERTLAANTSRWLIATMHHPPYSAGAHGSDMEVRDNFAPLFERYGTDLVLTGHDHDYQRSEPINGVVYVVSGAAAKLRPTGREEFTEVSWSVNSFVVLEFFEDRIEGKALTQLGSVIDSFTIVKP